jgi:SHS2 domain-containing protein
LDHLLIDWLNELLFLFDTQRLLLDSIRVTVRGAQLTATACARPVDQKHDRMLHEVKAITYHGLRVERTSDGWLAEVILDI